MRMLALTLVVTLSLFATPAPTAAEDAGSAYRVHWAPDLTVTSVAAVGWLVPRLFLRDLVTPSCPCNQASINPIDRSVAGVNRHGVALASDLTLAAVYSLGFALDAVDVRSNEQSWTNWLEDALVMAETLTINGALNEATKIAVARPRPLLYGLPAGAAALRDPDNYLSFYSEHTAGAFALGLSYAQTFALRHPESPYRFAVYVAAVAAGSAVAGMRVLAGKHFPTDVVTGAAVGTALGLVVPWLHARGPSLHLSAAVLPSGGLVVLSFVGS